MKRVREKGRLKLQGSPSEEMTEEDLNKLLADAAIPEDILKEMSVEEKKMNCRLLLKTKPKPDTLQIVEDAEDGRLIKKPNVRTVRKDERRAHEKTSERLESRLTLRSRKKGLEEGLDDQPTTVLKKNSPSSDEEVYDDEEGNPIKSDGRSMEMERSTEQQKDTNRDAALKEMQNLSSDEDAVTQDPNPDDDFILAPNTERFPGQQSSSPEYVEDQETIPETQTSPMKEIIDDINNDVVSPCKNLMWLPRYAPSCFEDPSAYTQVIELMFSIYLRRVRYAQHQIKRKHKKWGEPVRCGSCFKGLLRRQFCASDEEEGDNDTVRPKRYPTRSASRNVLSRLSMTDPYKWNDVSDENHEDERNLDIREDEEQSENRKVTDQKKKVEPHLSPEYVSGNEILSGGETIPDSDGDSKDSDFDPNFGTKSTSRNKKTKNAPARRKNPQKGVTKMKKAKNQIHESNEESKPICINDETTFKTGHDFLNSYSDESRNSVEIGESELIVDSKVCDKTRHGGEKLNMPGASGWLSTSVSPECLRDKQAEKNALDLLTYDESQISSVDASKKRRVKKKVNGSKPIKNVQCGPDIKSFMIDDESADIVSLMSSRTRKSNNKFSSKSYREENLSHVRTAGDSDGSIEDPVRVISSDEETQDPHRCSTSNAVMAGICDNQSSQSAHSSRDFIVISHKDKHMPKLLSKESQDTSEETKPSHSKKVLGKKRSKCQKDEEIELPGLFEDFPEEIKPKRKRPQRDPERKMPPRKRKQQSEDADLAEKFEGDSMVTKNTFGKGEKKLKIVVDGLRKQSTRQSIKLFEHPTLSDEENSCADVVEVEDGDGILGDGGQDIDDDGDAQIPESEMGTCPICGKKFPTASLEVHASTCSDFFVEQDNVARCMICREEFSLDELKAHQTSCLENHELPETRSRRKPKPEITSRSEFSRTMRTRNMPTEEESPVSSHDDYGELVVESDLTKE